ncbi:hypothetical protein EBZ80_24940 [bacterium]|nr:hypothetical protein [bacterium]
MGQQFIFLAVVEVVAVITPTILVDQEALAAEQQVVKGHLLQVQEPQEREAAEVEVRLLLQVL